MHFGIMKNERPPINDDTPFLNRNNVMVLVNTFMKEYNVNIIEALAHLLEESSVLDEQYQFDEYDIVDILTKDEIENIRLVAKYELGYDVHEEDEQQYEENILEDGDFWI